jgi:hypothetical protein
MNNVQMQIRQESKGENRIQAPNKKAAGNAGNRTQKLF